MGRIYPGITLAHFALVITEDLRVAVAAAGARAKDIRADAAALRSTSHPNFGKPGHQLAVKTAIRELEEESSLLCREVQNLRKLVDLLTPYVGLLADAER